MKVLLINPGPKNPSSDCVMPLGLIYIGSMLEKKHEVKICDLATDYLEYLLNVVRTFKPDVIGVSFTHAVHFNKAIDIIRNIKKIYKGGIFVGGGTHINFLKDFFEYFFQNKFLDFIIGGEGEHIFKNLIDSIGKSKPIEDVKGVYYYKEGKVRYTGKADIVDLNELPMPDFDLIDIEKYDFFWLAKPFVTLDWSRSCPHNCRFCTTKDFFGPYRTRKAEEILNQIIFLKKKYGIKGILFVDENFFGNVSETKKLLKMIISKKLNLVCFAQVRIDSFLLHPELISLSREAGIIVMLLGVEDPNEKILEYYNKIYDTDKVKGVIKKLRKNNIFTIASMIVGSPMETIETIKEKTNFVAEINPNGILYQRFVPHGKLMKKYFKERRIKNRDFDTWGHEVFICETNFDEREAESILSKSVRENFKRNMEENKKHVIGRKFVKRTLKLMRENKIKPF